MRQLEKPYEMSVGPWETLSVKSILEFHTIRLLLEISLLKGTRETMWRRETASRLPSPELQSPIYMLALQPKKTFSVLHIPTFSPGRQG